MSEELFAGRFKIFKYLGHDHYECVNCGQSFCGDDVYWAYHECDSNKKCPFCKETNLDHDSISDGYYCHKCSINFTPGWAVERAIEKTKVEKNE